MGGKRLNMHEKTMFRSPDGNDIRLCLPSGHVAVVGKDWIELLPMFHTEAFDAGCEHKTRNLGGGISESESRKRKGSVFPHIMKAWLTGLMEDGELLGEEPTPLYIRALDHFHNQNILARHFERVWKELKEPVVMPVEPENPVKAAREAMIEIEKQSEIEIVDALTRPTAGHAGSNACGDTSSGCALGPGTHRSDPAPSLQGLDAVGISGLQVGEDVNKTSPAIESAPVEKPSVEDKPGKRSRTVKKSIEEDPFIDSLRNAPVPASSFTIEMDDMPETDLSDFMG